MVLLGLVVVVAEEVDAEPACMRRRSSDDTRARYQRTTGKRTTECRATYPRPFHEPAPRLSNERKVLYNADLNCRIRYFSGRTLLAPAAAVPLLHHLGCGRLAQ